MPEKGREENCIETVDDIFYSYLWLDVKNGIDKAHRMGAVHKGRNPRPIIVRFTKHSTKEEVFRLKRYLKGSQLGIQHHEVEDLHENYSILKKVKELAKEQDSEAKIVGDKIRFRKTLYRIEDLQHTGLNAAKIHE